MLFHSIFTLDMKLVIVNRYISESQLEQYKGDAK